jgi:hypothetical protein
MGAEQNVNGSCLAMACCCGCCLIFESRDKLVYTARGDTIEIGPDIIFRSNLPSISLVCFQLTRPKLIDVRAQGLAEPTNHLTE